MIMKILDEIEKNSKFLKRLEYANDWFIRNKIYDGNKTYIDSWMSICGTKCKCIGSKIIGSPDFIISFYIRPIYPIDAIGSNKNGATVVYTF